MTTKEILKQTAIECLQGMIRCHMREDLEGVNFFAAIYTTVLKDMADFNNSANYLTEAQGEYVFADMQIDATGKLISTPEHK
jgi:hypothetical protein